MNEEIVNQNTFRRAPGLESSQTRPLPAGGFLK